MQRREANERNGEFDDILLDNLLAQDEAFDNDLPGNLLAQDEGIMQRTGANERNGEFDGSALGNLLAQKVRKVRGRKVRKVQDGISA